MLPTVSKGRGTSAVRPAPGFSQYLRRIVKWQQMDIEYTFWQMLHLCTSPKVVYQHTKYHKQTKNQWARDDPAFAVIFCLFFIVATSAYCAAYGVTWVHSVFTVISVVVFHFLLAGTILATCCWFLTNTYMREETPSSHAVEQRVEWLYAFDVHCNSFFPAFVLLYVIQYFVSPLLVAHGFFPMLVSNLLFMVAISYYHYLNFLGYDGMQDMMLSITLMTNALFLSEFRHGKLIARCSREMKISDAVLPFLDKTTFFLYPIGLVIILSPLMILSGFNPTRYMMRLYFG